jgi:hypothetical protein
MALAGIDAITGEATKPPWCATPTTHMDNFLPTPNPGYAPDSDDLEIISNGGMFRIKRSGWRRGSFTPQQVHHAQGSAHKAVRHSAYSAFMPEKAEQKEEARVSPGLNL